jgi:Domain of unknown function (DUF4157)
VYDRSHPHRSTGQRGAGPAPVIATTRSRWIALQRALGNSRTTRLIELQRAAGTAGPEPTSVPEVLRGAGRPLEPGVKARMEETLDADFSQVRVHTDTVAQRSTTEIGARAYTSGEHVVLGSGAHDLHTLAHELWHVRQQRHGPVAGTDTGDGLSISDPHDRFEREAEMVADRVVRTRGALGHHSPSQPGTPGHAPATSVQRALFGSGADEVAAEELRRGRRERLLRPTTGDPAEEELRRLRRERLDRAYGELVGPKTGRPKLPELDDRDDVRLNPLWYRLDDFPPALLLERKGALWHYSVGADGELSLGSEKPRGVLQTEEWTALLDGMHEAHPELTLEQLREDLDSQGHPTIAAGFDDTGRTTVEPGRVSGELQWNAKTERFEVSDKSGRYMSAGVRPGLTAGTTRRWLANVARRMTRHFGVTIHPVVIKNR